MVPIRFIGLAAASALAFAAGPCAAVSLRDEATVRGGTYAAQDQDEAAAGYIHVKYSSDLSTSRKAYVQFDLAGASVPTGAAGLFQIAFQATNTQYVQLWALNQAYDGFASNVTWNTAQANDTAGNGMLTAGAATATALGAPVLLTPTGTGAVHAFVVPNLAARVFNQRVTLVIAGVTHANNNAGGARFRRGLSTLTVVPRRRRDVYILAGQSNMDGRGYTSQLTGGLAGWAAPQTDVLICYRNPGSSGYETSWQVLAPGVSVPPGFTGTLPSPRFGPELAFATEIQRLEPGRPIALIKVTEGGTSLYGDWNPANHYLYTELTNKVPRALAELAALGDDGTIQGFLWHQGESDGSEPYASQYAANFSNLVAHLRADLNLPALRVVVGDLNTNKNAAVRAALAAVGDDPLGGFAPSTGFATVDGTHFDTPAVIEFGQRYARAMRDVDEDGCRDLWELDHFDSLAVAQGDATDYDHDGASDRAEDIAGTNPTNAASFFRTSGGRDAGGGLVLSWPGATGRTYRVWRTLDWGASWSDISGALPTNVHTDSAPPSSVGFYRVSVQAP